MFTVSGLLLFSRFDHFRKLALPPSIRKEDILWLATLPSAGNEESKGQGPKCVSSFLLHFFFSTAVQNPGRKEYPIEMAKRDGFTLLNSWLLCTM